MGRQRKMSALRLLMLAAAAAALAAVLRNPIFGIEFKKDGEDMVSYLDEEGFTNLYIENLDPDISDRALHEIFSDFGKVVRLIVAKDFQGRSRGFGFVEYDCPDNAMRATEKMNGTLLGSKVLYVERTPKPEEGRDA